MRCLRQVQPNSILILCSLRMRTTMPHRQRLSHRQGQPQSTSITSHIGMQSAWSQIIQYRLLLGSMTLRTSAHFALCMRCSSFSCPKKWNMHIPRSCCLLRRDSLLLLQGHTASSAAPNPGPPALSLAAPPRRKSTAGAALEVETEDEEGCVVPNFREVRTQTQEQLALAAAN